MGTLAVLGAGGHAKVVADAALCSSGFADVAFFSDGESLSFVVGDTQDLIANKSQFSGVVIAIGDNRVRTEKFRELRDAGLSFATVVHPAAVVASSALIGEGTVVLARTVVNSDAKISANCILNTACIIEHDCMLGDSVHISPGVALGGGVVIGARSWVGIGATVKHGVRIASNVIVGAGGVVVSHIQNAGVHVGCPVKQI